jgi:chemotaxis protein MotB
MKRKRKPEGGSDWMSTYGDMVTLLLCFFILLYSISSVDQQKWEVIVKSLNPEAEEVAKPEPGPEIEIPKVEDTENPIIEEEGEDPFDELYHTLKKAVKKQELESKIELTKGDGFTFISFKDQIFFDGESSVLKKEGKDILDIFVNILGNANDIIQEINVLGHTSQAAPGQPNRIYTDRMLASNRSTEVIVYLQAKGTISPEKLVQTSFGQYRPIASFETSEGRAKNRRVELIITKNDAVQKSLNEYYEAVYSTSE